MTVPSAKTLLGATKFCRHVRNWGQGQAGYNGIRQSQDHTTFQAGTDCNTHHSLNSRTPDPNKGSGTIPCRRHLRSVRHRIARIHHSPYRMISLCRKRSLRRNMTQVRRCHPGISPRSRMPRTLPRTGRGRNPSLRISASTMDRRWYQPQARSHHSRNQPQTSSSSRANPGRDSCLMVLRKELTPHCSPIRAASLPNT